MKRKKIEPKTKKKPSNETKTKATTKRWIADDFCCCWCRRLWFYVAVLKCWPQKAAFPVKTMCSFSAHHKNIGCFVWFVYWSVRLYIVLLFVRPYAFPCRNKNPVLFVCAVLCLIRTFRANTWAFCIWCTIQHRNIWHTHIQTPTATPSASWRKTRDTRKQQNA